MIVDKILEFVGNNQQKELKPEFMSAYTDDIYNAVKRQYLDEYEDRRKLRVSSLGRCLRSQAYNILGYPKLDSITPRLKMLFHMGDVIEANLVVLAQYSGVDIQDQQLEVEFEGVKGHVDGTWVDPDTNLKYLVEIKSMSDYSFQKFKRVGMKDDGFGYVTQATVYAKALNCDKIIWIGQNKNNSKLHEEIRDVDENLIKNVIYNVDALKLCKDPEQFGRYEVEEELWYKKPTGNKILPFQCSTCDFVQECFKGATKYERKGKIKHYSGEIKHGKWSEGGRIIT